MRSRRLLPFLAASAFFATGCLPEVMQEASLRDPRAVTVLDSKEQVVLAAGPEAKEVTIPGDLPASDAPISVRRDEKGELWVGARPIVDVHGRLVVRRDGGRLPTLDAPAFRDGALYLSYIHSEPRSVSLETSTHLVFATPASNVLVVRERREARFDPFVFGLSLVFAAGGSVLVADGLAHPERSGDDRMLEIGFGALALLPGLTGLLLEVSALVMPRRDRVLYESQTRKGEPN